MPKDRPLRMIDDKTTGTAYYGGSASSGGAAALPEHNTLPGLTVGDPHTQYHNDTRGDVRYPLKTLTLTAGAGLTGGGDLSTNRAFVVGAGYGITVNENDVALASTVAGAALSYTDGVLAVVPGEGLEIETDAIGLRADVAGNGLTYSSGVLAVGVANTGAAGLSVEADAVRLTSNSDPDASAAILATTSQGLLTLRNGAFRQAAQSQATFASGFAGSGWRADYGVTAVGRASIETDDLTVRGRLRVYELLIQQIRATNGSLFVSSASKVVSVTASANPLWTVNGVQLTFNGSNATLSTTLYTISTAAAGDTARELYHGFLYGDIIRAQQVQWNGSEFAGVIQSNLEVTSVTNLYTYGAVLVSGDAPAAGYDYVRLGSTTDTTRQGSVYITSDDSAAPFIDIVDGVSSHAEWNSANVARVRLGKLSGISDVDFGGPLSGYGLYANRAYIEGTVIVTGGSLGGLAAADVNSNTTTIDGGKITANTITANQIAANTITANQIAANTITASRLSVTNLADITGTLVVGTTNKLWLNDSNDGSLAIGGTVKANAPTSISAAGQLVSTNATFGNLSINTSGAYITTPTAYSVDYGYKFRYGAGGSYGGGLIAQYNSGAAANMWLLNNTNASATLVDASADATLTVRSTAGSGKTGSIDLRAERIVSGAAKFTGLSLLNTSTSRKATVHADTFVVSPEAGGEYKIWHENNDGADSTLDADTLDTKHASDFALLGGNNTFNYVTTFAGAVNCDSYIRLSPLSSAPAYQSNYALIFLLNAGNGNYQLRAKIRSADGTKFVDYQITTT